MHEQMLSSSVRFIVVFLVPYMALSIQVPSSENNESNHDVLSATENLICGVVLVWFFFF